MPFANAIVEAGVEGLAALYRAHAVTPLEATNAYLSRIDRLDGPLHSYVHLDAAGARAAAQASARRWAAGVPLSPVDGAPLAVKANIAVAGLPWHGGIAAYRDRIAPADAGVVTALRAAGAVVLGLVNMHEGALGATTDNPAFGRTHNPHRHGFTPGGSSGGSGAAVAAGLCAAALGTDTMGSARIPSAYCGVFGAKPLRGRLDEAGVIALSWTLDQVGVHARSAGDMGVVLAAASGPDERVDEARPWAALQFDGQVEVEPSVAEAYAAVLDRARSQGVSWSPLRLADHDFGRLRRLGLLVSEVEGAVVHEAALACDPGGFSAGFAALLAWGGRQPAPRYAKALRDLQQARTHLLAALGHYAGLLSPTAPQAAFAFGREAPANQADFTALANITGLSASAFPAGLSADGLPLSVQAMGWTDGSTLATAARLAASVSTPVDITG